LQAQSHHSTSSLPHLHVVHPVGSPPPVSVREVAQHFARRIAEAADADQWSIILEGVDDGAHPDLEELVPRQWLEYLNSRRPAIYRLSLPLRTGHREVGLVRLGTTDPAGFGPAQIARARSAANAAAQAIAQQLDLELGRRRSSSTRKRRTASDGVIQLADYRPVGGLRLV
jgi:hypothetical protein